MYNCFSAVDGLLSVPIPAGEKMEELRVTFQPHARVFGGGLRFGRGYEDGELKSCRPTHLVEKAPNPRSKVARSRVGVVGTIARNPLPSDTVDVRSGTIRNRPGLVGSTRTASIISSLVWGSRISPNSPLTRPWLARKKVGSSRGLLRLLLHLHILSKSVQRARDFYGQ